MVPLPRDFQIYYQIKKIKTSIFRDHYVMVNISLSPKRRTIINSFGKHQNYDARSPILWCPFKLTNSFFVLIWKIKIGTFIFWVFYVSLYVLRKTWFYQDVPGINECTVPKNSKNDITMVPPNVADCWYTSSNLSELVCHSNKKVNCSSLFCSWFDFASIVCNQALFLSKTSWPQPAYSLVRQQ